MKPARMAMSLGSMRRFLNLGENSRILTRRRPLGCSEVIVSTKVSALVATVLLGTEWVQPIPRSIRHLSISPF